MHWEYHTGGESNELESQTDQMIYELHELIQGEIGVLEDSNLRRPAGRSATYGKRLYEA